VRFAKWIVVVVHVSLATMLALEVPVRPVTVFHGSVIVRVAVSCGEMFPAPNTLIGVSAVVRDVNMLVAVLNCLVKVGLRSCPTPPSGQEPGTKKGDAQTASQERKLRPGLFQL
jgi:hypothetical protein